MQSHIQKEGTNVAWYDTDTEMESVNLHTILSLIVTLFVWGKCSFYFRAAADRCGFGGLWA